MKGEGLIRPKELYTNMCMEGGREGEEREGGRGEGEERRGREG